jgi:pilus assembly protein Flp/PilA
MNLVLKVTWRIKMNKFVRFMNDESGATAIEYGLIAAAMGTCLIAAMPSITAALSSKFATIGTAISK